MANEKAHSLNRTLFEITDDMLAFHDYLVSLEGDVTGQEQAIDEWFNRNEKDFNNKLDGYGVLIREEEARAVSLRSEAQRLLDLAKTHDNIASGLRDRAVVNLSKIGCPKVETLRFKFSVANNGGKAPIRLVVDEGELPKEFQAVQVVPDMKKLREQLEDYLNRLNEYRKANPGTSEEDAADAIEKPPALQYAYLAERGQHLRLK